MSTDCVLALDIGTSGVMAAVYSMDGRKLASAYSEFQPIYPKPGWVEQDAEQLIYMFYANGP